MSEIDLTGAHHTEHTAYENTRAMPIYHFHIHDDVSGTSPDWTGTELPDVISARREAMRLAGVTIADCAFTGRRFDEWHLEVTDHDGRALIVMDFLTSAASLIETAR